MLTKLEFKPENEIPWRRFSPITPMQYKFPSNPRHQKTYHCQFPKILNLNKTYLNNCSWTIACIPEWNTKKFLSSRSFIILHSAASA